MHVMAAQCQTRQTLGHLFYEMHSAVQQQPSPSVTRC
jgi:hypothetical protein